MGKVAKMYDIRHGNALKKCENEQQSARPVATEIELRRHQAKTYIHGNSTERVNIY